MSHKKQLRELDLFITVAYQKRFGPVYLCIIIDSRGVDVVVVSFDMPTCTSLSGNSTIIAVTSTGSSFGCRYSSRERANGDGLILNW